jgi:putative nucleotidyltransferase with HDIG domain
MGKSLSLTEKLAEAFRRDNNRNGNGNVDTGPSDVLTNQIAALTHQLELEKRRTMQLTLLWELSQQLEALLDEPVAAQLSVNTLERGIDCSFVCLYTHDTEHNEFVALASAGKKASLVPPGFRQSTLRGMKGRATRLRKTQIANDTRLDGDYIPFENENSLSTLVVPLIYNGHLKGMIEVNHDETDAFHNADVTFAESVATELARAWERSSYYQHLKELIQAGISLTTIVSPQTVVQEIAVITRQALQARYVNVTLLDQAGNLTQKSFAGNAPKLHDYLEKEQPKSNIMQATLQSSHPFRIRDIRKNPLTANIEIDNSRLRSLLAIPIRLHRLSIGAILAFGKEGEIFFSENDESLATLLSSQVAASVESTWLYQELRNTLTTATQLYQVSFQILQTEELERAVQVILEATCKVANASSAGIILFTPDHQISIKMGMDKDGVQENMEHPVSMIEQAMSSGTNIFLSDQSTTQVCFPIQTHLRKYGGLWLKVAETINYDSRHTAALQTLANQLERAILLEESRRQAKEIEAAYEELEVTYDRTLAALMSALDARDRETEGHSIRVSQMACKLGEAMNIDAHELKALERGSLLHDIGKIGISDTILHKPGPLSDDEWKIMRLHPDIGAHIVEDIPFLQDTISIIQHHQERWDGSGYPAKLKGKEIPILARIFAVVDAFDALTSKRPYRKPISPEEAVIYLREQSGILFDPEIVLVFEKLVHDGHASELLESR